jgi:RimJ/RimL family protein N-acetyltransferase
VVDEPDHVLRATRGTPLPRQFPRELETDHLRLVESDPAFAPQLAAAMQTSTADLAFASDWREAADPAVAERALLKSLELADVDVVRHAFLRKTGEYVSRLDLHSWDVETPRCEIGYIANSQMTGRGLVTEGCLAMIAAARQMGVVRVQAMCDPRNKAGIRMAERLGMQREGVLRCYERDDAGALTDLVVLSAVWSS